MDAEQMDNVSSAIVLQPMMNFRLKFADWGFVFKECLKEPCHSVIRVISLRTNCFVECETNYIRSSAIRPHTLQS